MAEVLRGQMPQAALTSRRRLPAYGAQVGCALSSRGLAGLQDRSSRPRRLYRPTPPQVFARIEALRRERRSRKHIAKEVGVSPATVSRVLKRLGLNKLMALDPLPPVRRYERAHPGELIHIDIKLGRFERVGHRTTGDRTGQSTWRSSKRGGTGSEFVHVCIDDASRVAFSQTPWRRNDQAAKPRTAPSLQPPLLRHAYAIAEDSACDLTVEMEPAI